MNEDLKNNPKLSGIDPEKLSMLQGLAQKGAGMSPSDLLPFLMQSSSQGKSNGLHFNQQEISAILNVMKMGKSPEETAKIDRIVSMMKMIK